jgi:hypothetical protein
MVGRVQVDRECCGSHNLSVAQRLQSLVPVWERLSSSINHKSNNSNSPNVDRMLHRLLPVFILVLDGGEDLVEMVAVGAPHIVPQNLRLAVGLDAVLNVAGVEYEV